jgi:serine protease inhibitor
MSQGGEWERIIGKKSSRKQCILSQIATALQSFSMQASSGNTLDIANKLFAADDLKLKPDFKKALETFYNSNIQNVDFKQPQVNVTSISMGTVQTTSIYSQKKWEHNK